MLKTQNQMKLFKYIVMIALAVAVAAGFSSCRKRSHNGRLDGQWQILTIEYKETGEVETPPAPTHYICINLHVVNLTLKDEKEYIGGNLVYDKDAGRVMMNFPEKQYNKPTVDIRSFGMVEPDMDFRILELTGSRLILSSDRVVITCRRF